jgi:LysR family transcriptional regulator, regulator for metE and metH
MDLEIRHLRLVDAIASAGSVTRAADCLHLTQSALSHQLRDVEGRLGTPLFLRVGKRMVLTPAGHRVLEAAARVLEDIERTEEDIRRLSVDGAGEIRVCTQCNTGYHWLPPLLKIFHQKHPRVQVTIAVDATNRPIEYLMAGKLDLAVITDSAGADRRVRVRPLFKDEMVALVARDHRLAARSWIRAEDLASEHVVLYASDPRQSFTMRRILEPARVVPRRVSFIMLSEAIIEMAKAGIGIGVMPRWSAQGAIQSGGVRPLSFGRRGMHRQWSAATLRSQAEAAHLTDFIDLLAARALPARAAIRAS